MSLTTSAAISEVEKTALPALSGRPWSRWPLSLLALPVAVMLDLRDLTEQLSRRQANDISQIINDIRTLYANDVVGRVLQAPHGTKITATDNFRDVPGAIPIPATFSIELGKLTSARDNTVRYEFVSDYPVRRPRAAYDSIDFQKSALAAFRADPTIADARGRRKATGAGRCGSRRRSA